MLIPSLTTIRVEDFPTQKEWIGSLLLPLNQFLLSAISAINGNVTFGDNIPCQTQSLLFSYGAETDFPKTFKWNLPNKPVEIRVCSATENDLPIGIVAVWAYANGQVSITSLVKVSTSGAAALVRNSRYNIVLRGQP